MTCARSCAKIQVTCGCNRSTGKAVFAAAQDSSGKYVGQQQQHQLLVGAEELT